MPEFSSQKPILGLSPMHGPNSKSLHKRQYSWLEPKMIVKNALQMQQKKCLENKREMAKAYVKKKDEKVDC